VTRLYHGGMPGLRPGDILAGGHDRRTHDGCPICEARAKGEHVIAPDGSSIDAPTGHADQVYATEDREYGRFYASLWGYGDLYSVALIAGEEWEWSTEDPYFPTIRTGRLAITGIVARAVVLTMQQRRRLHTRWGGLVR
jgi:hypothetical protein